MAFMEGILNRIYLLGQVHRHYVVADMKNGKLPHERFKEYMYRIGIYLKKLCPCVWKGNIPCGDLKGNPALLFYPGNLLRIRNRR